MNRMVCAADLPLDKFKCCDLLSGVVSHSQTFYYQHNILSTLQLLPAKTQDLRLEGIVSVRD